MLVVEQRVLQPNQLLFLDRFRDLAGQRRGRGAWTGGIFEREGLGVADLPHQLQGLFELAVALARKADDEVAGQGDIRPRAADPLHQAQIVFGRVPPVHRLQHPVRPRLHRQMQEGHQRVQFAMGGDQRLIHVAGVAGGVADAGDATNLGQPPRQPGQAAFAGVGVDVLAQEGELAHALGRQMFGLGQDRLHRPGVFRAAGIGHHAEGAELVAALLHGEEGGDAGDGAIGGKGVELLFRREIGRQPLAQGAMGAGDQFRQLVVGLRANDEIHRRLAAHDLLALGLGDAAGDGDGHGPAPGRLGQLQRLDPAQFGIGLLGGLFADVAGVEHHQIGAFGGVGQPIAQRGQDIGHPLAVIDVHLTAVGLDIEALLRGPHHGICHGRVMRLGAPARKHCSRSGYPGRPKNSTWPSGSVISKPRRPSGVSCSGELNSAPRRRSSAARPSGSEVWT